MDLLGFLYTLTDWANIAETLSEAQAQPMNSPNYIKFERMRNGKPSLQQHGNTEEHSPRYSKE